MIATLVVLTIAVYVMLRMKGWPSVRGARNEPTAPERARLLGLLIITVLVVGFTSSLVVAILLVTAYLLFRHRRRVVAVVVRVFHRR